MKYLILSKYLNYYSNKYIFATTKRIKRLTNAINLNNRNNKYTLLDITTADKYEMINYVEKLISIMRYNGSNINYNSDSDSNSDSGLDSDDDDYYQHIMTLNRIKSLELMIKHDPLMLFLWIKP